MNYSAFRAAWDEALKGTGLVSYHDQPEEIIELGGMERRYKILLGVGHPQPAEPFLGSLEISWDWDPLQSARSRTTEEDVLTGLLGREGAQDRHTERPWLRVDLKLHGKLALDKPLLLPSTEVWRAWRSETMAPMEDLLPVEGKRLRGGATAVLSWRGEPEAEVQCGPQGELWLHGVELVAWEGVELPRQWDDTGRKPDEGPEKHLVEMLKRWADALEIWRKRLTMLLPAVRAVN
jgi:hypothetical protein